MCRSSSSRTLTGIDSVYFRHQNVLLLSKNVLALSKTGGSARSTVLALAGSMYGMSFSSEVSGSDGVGTGSFKAVGF